MGSTRHRELSDANADANAATIHTLAVLFFLWSGRKNTQRGFIVPIVVVDVVFAVVLASAKALRCRGVESTLLGCERRLFDSEL